ncbi:MAG: hypothetical protein IK115_11700 [Lachnospiraceae bacterium]|nr:hypothetical protein [Lachnospiraceae bacterium]
MQDFMQDNGTVEAESSYAERYMNETSGGVQAGPRRRSPAPKIAVSIPYGEESGGLISQFRKLFGKKDPSAEEEDTDIDEAPRWEENPAYEQEGEEFENPLYDEDEAREERDRREPLASVRNGDKKIAAGHDRARELSEEVINNEQRHFGKIRIKDGQFASVRSSVKALNSKLDQPYPKTDTKKQNDDMKGILDQYLATIGTLRDYITHIQAKKGARSPSGRARLDLVSQLLGLLEQDHHMFGTCAEQLSRGVNAGINSWDDILRNARATDLRADGASFQVVGAGSSRIIKRTVGNNDEYIKAEEKTVTQEGYAEELITMFGNTSPEGKKLIRECMEYFEKNPLQGDDGPLAPKACMERYLRTYYGNDSNVFLCGMPPKKKDQSDADYRQTQLAYVMPTLKAGDPDAPEMRGLWDFIASDEDRALCFADAMSFVKKKNMEQSTSEGAMIKAGSTISDRNESSSILAERMGLENLVAKSQSILMENASGDVVRANVMAGAKGKSIVDWEDEATALEKADKEARAKEKTDRPPLQILLTYTPHALMKLNELLILDMISGQVDRNRGNFMVEVEQNPPGEDGKAMWYITSVMGIDNDMAFGTLLYDMFAKDGRYMTIRGFTDKFTGRTPDGKWGETQQQTVFYISRSTYEHIMGYTPEMASMDQRHLRSKEEIEALKNRLLGVKKQLKEMVDGGLITLAENATQEQEGYNKTKSDLKHLYVGMYIDKEKIR